MSNLSNIGFPIKTDEEFMELVQMVDKDGIPAESAKGIYIYYSDQSGAELWLQVDKHGEFIGFQPFFKGTSHRQLVLEHAVERSHNFLNGALSASFISKDTALREKKWRFVFDMPNFDLFTPISFPRTATVQLSAFAQTLEYWENEIAYTTKTGIYTNSNKSSSSNRYFQFVGLSSAPTSECAITGKIVQWEQKKNTSTGEIFYWLLIRTTGGEIDLVADESYFTRPLRVNGIVRGRFWLSATLINISQ